MYKPIKMKRSMKYGSNYWEGYSPKVKRTVRFFSDLEYDHWVMVETNPNIETFCEQPIRIKQILNEEISESVIDMWVRYKNGEEIFFEIKYLSELDKRNPKSARAIKQIAAQKTWCEEKGYKHVCCKIKIPTFAKIHCRHSIISVSLYLTIMQGGKENDYNGSNT